MNGFIQGYYRVSEWIMRLAYVNILWIAFTILGFGIFGFMPATVAMFAVVRKWVLGEVDIKIFPIFWKSYKKEFTKSNMLGFILLIIGYILSLELHILRASDQIMYLIASFGVLALILLYGIVIMYFFPIYVHFNLKMSEYIKWPFIIGIIHPLLTVFLMVGIGIMIYLTFSTLPALLIFFGGSIPAFILMWGASQTFNKYEQADVS